MSAGLSDGEQYSTYDNYSTVRRRRKKTERAYAVLLAFAATGFRVMDVNNNNKNYAPLRHTSDQTGIYPRQSARTAAPELVTSHWTDDILRSIPTVASKRAADTTPRPPVGFILESSLLWSVMVTSRIRTVQLIYARTNV